ncbi:MAG: DMT family transporter [Thiolinea sp.]
MAIEADSTRPQHILRGVILIIAAAFTISVQDVIFKLFSNTLTLWQIFTVRALLVFPLLFLLAWTQGIQHNVLRDALQKWPLLRSLFFTLTFMAFYAAIPFLSLSTVGAANYSAPIFIILLSVFVIREPVGWLGWLAVFTGFTGVIVLLQPGTDAFSSWAILPVIGACFYASAHVITRSKCQSTSLTALVLSLNIVMLVAGLVMSGLFLVWQPENGLTAAYPYIFGQWSAIGISEWLILGLLAILLVSISLGMAGAYKAAPPAIISTFEYSYLVFVAFWDYLFFATTPSSLGLLGMGLIIIAGLLVLRR